MNINDIPVRPIASFINTEWFINTGAVQFCESAFTRDAGRFREGDSGIAVINIFWRILSRVGGGGLLGRFSILSLGKAKPKSAFTYARTQIKGAGIIYIYSGDSMSICFYPSRPRPSPFTRRPKLDPFPRQRASSPDRAFSQSVSFPLRPSYRDSAIPALVALVLALSLAFSSSLAPSRSLANTRANARSGVDRSRESLLESTALSR